jgi:hypothetical protein
MVCCLILTPTAGRLRGFSVEPNGRTGIENDTGRTARVCHTAKTTNTGKREATFGVASMFLELWYPSHLRPPARSIICRSFNAEKNEEVLVCSTNRRCISLEIFFSTYGEIAPKSVLATAALPGINGGPAKFVARAGDWIALQQRLVDFLNLTPESLNFIQSDLEPSGLSKDHSQVPSLGSF